MKNCKIFQIPYSILQWIFVLFIFVSLFYFWWCFIYEKKYFLFSIYWFFYFKFFFFESKCKNKPKQKKYKRKETIWAKHNHLFLVFVLFIFGLFCYFIYFFLIVKQFRWRVRLQGRFALKMFSKKTKEWKWFATTEQIIRDGFVSV